MKKIEFVRIFVLSVICYFAISCKTIAIESNTETKNESVTDRHAFVGAVSKDTERILDSVRVEYKKGETDTIYIERWRTATRSIMKYDTICILRTDTIKMYYEKSVKSNKVKSRWYLFALFGLIFGAFFGVFLCKKLRFF